MNSDGAETLLSKAALKVIEDLEQVKSWPPAERRKWMQDNREQLSTLLLVINGALADEDSDISEQ